MNPEEFRAVLDWWMGSDLWNTSVSWTHIDSWLTRESHLRGYDTIIVAYHEHQKNPIMNPLTQRDLLLHIIDEANVCIRKGWTQRALFELDHARAHIQMPDNAEIPSYPFKLGPCHD